MSWFTAERQVLNASVSLAARSDFGFPAWQLALTLEQLYQWRGFFHDWMHTMGIALAAAERDADLPGQGHILTSLAGAGYYLNRHAEAHQGELQRAIEHHQKALELYREAGYRRGEARAIAEEISTLHQEGKVRKDLGIVRAKLGQRDEAVEQFHRALDLLRHVGHRSLEAETLLALGDTLAAQGQDDAACDAWQQAYLIFSAAQLPQSEKLKGRLLTYGRSPTALTTERPGTSAPSWPGGGLLTRS